MSSNPRITILSLNFPPEPTGISPYVGSLARGFSERGARVNVLTTHPHYPEWAISEGYGQWTKREKFGRVSVTRFLHYVPKTASGLKRLVSEITFGLRAAAAGWDHPEVVLMLSPALFSTALGMLRIKLARRKPSVAVWVQDIYTLGVMETGIGGKLLTRFMKWMESSTFRSATLVIAIHPKFADYIITTLRVDPTRVKVVRNWTHLQEAPTVGVAAVRARHGWSAEDVVVLHAGNMGGKQGLETVVDAARLADAGTRPIRFVLLGNGNRRDALEEYARGVSSIQFLDPVEDQQFHVTLMAADVLLVNEKVGVSAMAVPSKLTSYFASGRPVIAATDPNGVTAGEVLAAGAGVIAKAGDPSALLRESLKLWDDPEKALAYGRNGLSYCQDVLGQDAAIDRYFELLFKSPGVEEPIS